MSSQYHLLRDGQRNVAGLVSFFFVEARFLLRDPRSYEALQGRSLVVEELPLSPDAVWYQGLVTRYTLDYNETYQTTRAGEFWQQQVEGVIARQSPELQEVISTLNRRRFVLVTRDNNGYLKLIGSKECPLTFGYRSQTGSNPRERNQISFRFGGDTRTPSLFVHGNLYDTLAAVEQPDFGDTTVQQRVLADGISIRILT